MICNVCECPREVNEAGRCLGCEIRQTQINLAILSKRQCCDGCLHTAWSPERWHWITEPATVEELDLWPRLEHRVRCGMGHKGYYWRYCTNCMAAYRRNVTGIYERVGAAARNCSGKILLVVGRTVRS